MRDEIEPDEAARALAQIRDRQQQVIDVMAIPGWYWWVIGALMVGLGVAVDTGTPVAIGLGTGLFVLGVLAATGWVLRRALLVQLNNELLGARGVLLILGFVALVVVTTLAVAFGLRAAGVPFPATLADLVGALLLVVGAPRLMRELRRIMVGHRTGAAR